MVEREDHILRILIILAAIFLAGFDVAMARDSRLSAYSRVSALGAELQTTDRLVLTQGENRTLLHVIPLEVPGTTLDLQDNGAILVIGFVDGVVVAIDMFDRSPVWEVKISTQAVVDLHINRDRVAAVDRAGNAAMLDLATGRPASLPLPRLPLNGGGEAVSAYLMRDYLRIGLRDGTIFGLRLEERRWRSVPTERYRPNRADPPSIEAIVSETRSGRGDDRRPSICSREGCPGYFHWPPPLASGDTPLPLGALMGKEEMTFGDLDIKLRALLMDAGYMEGIEGSLLEVVPFRYYDGPPDGFVMLTRIERIGDDGEYLEPRWTDMGAGGRGEFSITDLIRKFFNINPGRYRFIALVLTNEALPDYSKAPLEKRDADLWVANGKMAIDSGMAKRRIDPENHKLYALIYEFVKPNNSSSAVFVRPSTIGGVFHAQKAGILPIVR